MQWEASVPVFRILSLTVGTQIILSTSGSIFQAAGDTRSLFISGLFSATLNVAGILTGIFIFKTLEAVAWGILVTFSINFVQCYMQMYYVTFKRKMNQFINVLISPLILSIILFVFLSVSSTFLSFNNLILSLIIKSVLSLVVWGMFLQVTKTFDIMEKIRSVFSK